nr:hypothetical protein [Tanacetum cinerariifolium]
MDNHNITMKEYIRLEEEKERRRGKVYNWETATYGKIWYNEDVYDLRSIETEFPAIVLIDALTSEVTLSCEPKVSPLNDNKINLRISFESDDEDYTGLLPALKDLFPAAEHRYYVRNIHDNMNLIYKGGHYKELLWKCATAEIEVGRPGKKRKKSVGEVTKMVKDSKLIRKGGTLTCCKCGQKRHNKRSCKGTSIAGSGSASGTVTQPLMASTSQPARASAS